MTHAHPELSQPPALNKNALRITPLGGLGEVGRNMTVFEYQGRLLIVDCGVLFPEEHQPGVDLILPDMEQIADRLDDIEAVVLTHGHEDHIGAVPYLLRHRKDIPLIGSRFTLALVEAKLQEHRITPVTDLVREGDIVSYGDFEVEFVAVNHSIPDALACCLRTPAGTVFLTGDFKLDQVPLDGRITDLRTFARLGEEGVDVFMVDSTNAEVPGFTSPEEEIRPTLDRYIGEAGTGKVIVATFASHVHRVQLVLDAAYLHGRKVCFVGRSMVRNMGIAADLGYLNVPSDDLIIDLKNAKYYKDGELVFVSTGSQGEPLAALSRMANREHRTITVEAGDTVILASSLIPGNEVSVSRLINSLMELGANVIHKGNAHVHVSGHACSGELLYCYNIVQPRNVIPMHGEIRHLIANGKLAVKTGVSPERVVLAENGIVVDLEDGAAKIVGALPVDNIYVDGSSVGEVTEVDLKDRRVLGVEGFISIFAVVDGANGTIVTGPHLQARGLAEDDAKLEEIQPQVEAALAEAAAKPSVSAHQMQQAMRRVVGRWASRSLRRAPMIVPTVLEV